MKKAILSILFLSFSIGSAFSVETLPIYIGVGTGIARYTGDETNNPLFLPGQELEDDQTFMEAYIGLDFSENFAFELNYAVFGDYNGHYLIDPDVAFIVSPNDEEKVDSSRITAMAVLDYPLTLGISVYVTGGYAYYNFERTLLGGFAAEEGTLEQIISNGDHGLEYGFGLKYEIIDRVSIRGQWTQSLIQDRNMQTNRLSVEFHF